ncbi:MAG TPA: hypothetical protein VEX86_18155, partial [Longimicrobium sp.]|nr:hypothetical protein [Longimicrobium sp.]
MKWIKLAVVALGSAVACMADATAQARPPTATDSALAARPDWVTGLVRLPARTPAEDAASAALRRRAFGGGGTRLVVSL